MRPWLTIDEASRYLNVSKASLRRWTKAGRLNCQRVGVRGERRFAAADLAAFLRDSTGPLTTAGETAALDPQGLLEAAARAGGVRHLCSHGSDGAESWRLFAPFFRDHAQSGAPIFYIYDATTRAQLRSAIVAAGWDPQALIDRGLLELVHSSAAYLRTGSFSAAAMLDYVGGVIERAQARGHRKMLFSGEMTWSLSGAPGSHEMIGYEDRLNDLLAGSPDVTIVCHYSTERFDAKLTLEALRVHPYVQLPAGLFRGFHSGRPAPRAHHSQP